MDNKGHKKIKPVKKNFQCKKEEVFRFEKNGKLDVNMGESLDIDIDCKEGFTVFIPYSGLFHPKDGSDQIFEASEINPPDTTDHINDKLWRVTITRKNQANPYANKEFAYCIYTPELDNFAVADSPPRMNLNP